MSVATGTQSTSLTFSPSSLATAVFTATYVGTDTSVTTTTFNSAAVTSTSNGTPVTMTIDSGDAQTAIAGANLALPLKVLVVDAFSAPVQGVSVSFTVLSGGGSIVTSMPTTTNASGIASATVQLGTVVVSNSFKATVVGYSSINKTFMATATPGAVTQLVWSQQPATCFTNSPCGTQPMVVAKDTNDNIATNAVGSITLSVASGCTGISGTGTATLNSGVATFSSVGCTGSGASVLTATLSAVTGNSASFTVSAAPPGACLLNDGAFSTGGGGCQDLTTGLAWSSITSSTVTWFNSVWDGSIATNSSSQDAYDLGRTNDYGDVLNSSTSAPDSSSTNYCHSLTEGAQNDWRMPSTLELTNLFNHGSPTHISGAAGKPVWNGLSSANAGINCVDLSTNSTTGASKGSSSLCYAICVRGGRTIADRLSVTSTNNTVFGINSTATISRNPITVQIKDSLGNLAHVQGVVVNVSTNNGSIGGTTAVTTVEDGTATFSAFTLDTTGTGTLTFSTATGFASTTLAYRAGSFPNTCLVEDSNFVTATGGCKQVSTGKIWSLPSLTSISWNDTIWDSALAANAGVQTDSYDSSRTNDYDPQTALTGSTDNSGTNYCHELTEGGYFDWRVPTCAELLTVYALGSGAGTHFVASPSALANFFWSSTSSGSNCSNGITSSASAADAAVVRLSTGLGSHLTKTTTTSVSSICVRP